MSSNQPPTTQATAPQAAALPALRPHIALAATDVAATTAFYAALFGVPPSKTKPGYAKFDLQSPALNLSINQATALAPNDTAFHMGIEVASSADVAAWKARVEAERVSVALEETAVTCCYAVQDKFWVADPDGHRWEVFVVHADAEVHSANRQVTPSTLRDDQTSDGDTSDGKACCEPTCCT